MTLVPNYVPTDWVDTVTPVDESRMDKIDTAIDQHADAINALDTRLVAEEGMADIPTVVNGKWIKGVGGALVWSDITIADVATLQTSLNAKENQSAKGAANGYAPLDSSSKVPVANLPSVIDLRWAGTYAGATAYKEGDVVIYNGVSYIALRPTTGETPVPWSAGAGGALPYSTVTLASDFAFASGNAYQDLTGMSLASLAAGTYLISGAVYIWRGANTGFVAAKLWDGTAAPVAVGENNTSSYGSGNGPMIPLLGIAVLSATTTLKVSAMQAANGHTVKAATSSAAGTTAGTSFISAVKIA